MLIQEQVFRRDPTLKNFLKKLKKINTLQYFDVLDSDYSENFTNATILQLHNLYGNKSKTEINGIVNKFLSLVYDLPKKKEKQWIIILMEYQEKK